MAVLLAAAIPVSADQAAPLLSLGQMFRAIAENSNVARVGDLDTARARAVTEELRASYKPTVEMEGGYVFRDNPVMAIFGDFRLPMGLENFAQAEISARELLWDQGQRAKAIEAGKSAVDAAIVGREAQIVRAQIEGMGAYLQTVLAAEQRRVVEQRIRSLEVHLKDAQNLYDQGMVARNDLLETKVRLSSVKDQLHDVANQLAIARSKLNRLMGRDPGTPMDTPQSLSAPPPLPAEKKVLLDETAENSPELAALKAQLQTLQIRRDADSLENSPKLVLSAAHTFEQNPYMAYDHANLAKLGFSWKLFDGGALRQRITSEQFGIEKVRRNLEEARRQLATRFEQAFREYRQALRVAETAGANVDASLENLRIVSDQYRAGLARSSDVLDAETLLSTSRFTLAERRLAAYLQQATVLAIAGRDLPSFYEKVGSQHVEDLHE